MRRILRLGASLRILENDGAERLDQDVRRQMELVTLAAVDVLLVRVQGNDRVLRTHADHLSEHRGPHAGRDGERSVFLFSNRRDPERHVQRAIAAGSRGEAEQADGGDDGAARQARKSRYAGFSLSSQWR
jgi:hypothetical protein